MSYIAIVIVETLNACVHLNIFVLFNTFRIYYVSYMAVYDSI